MMAEVSGQFGLLAALAAALVLAGLVLFYRNAYLAARQASERSADRAVASEAALVASPVGCFAFSHLDGGERCTSSLAATLGLHDSDAADYSALLGTLGPDDAARLDQAVTQLKATGTAFSTTARHGDGRRVFQVHGSRVPLTGSGRTADYLWFTEVTEPTQALEAASAERDRHAALIDSLPLPVWIRDQNLDLIYCNATYSDAVGQTREAVVADKIELPGMALAEASRNLARRAAESGGTVRESHHVVVAGERRLLELCERPMIGAHVTGSHVTGPSGPDGDVIAGLLTGCAQDRTSVENVEGELARHINAHAEVLEALGSAIAIFGPDMRLKFFNSAFPRLWRLEDPVLEGEPHLTDLYEMLRERRRLPEHPDFPAFKKEQVRRFSTMIEPIEELIHVPDGSTIRMTVTPHPFGGVLFTYEDVTDRLALERSYNTLIAVQRETLDHLYEGVAVYGADGRLKLFTPAFGRIWELDPEVLEAEPHVRDVLEQTRKFFSYADSEWPRILEQLVVASTEPKADQGRYERLDGSVIDWAQVPLPDGASLFTYLDVTDSIRVERALRERNEALETADRLKSEFIANVSYELRTPLNAIMGFAEILENQFFGELNERQLEYSRAIVESSQRLLALINDILDLATIEAGYLRLDLATLQIQELLQSIEVLAHERARNRGIRFALDCPADIGTVIADERRVKQAVFNLVSNALKFTPDGGAVTMRARRFPDEVQLSVMDTGVGVAEADQDRVFGKFERSSGQTRQSGAGLGLSLVQSLIELHGGWVELASVPEEGTTVTCHLPLEPPAGDSTVVS